MYSNTYLKSRETLPVRNLSPGLPKSLSRKHRQKNCKMFQGQFVPLKVLGKNLLFMFGKGLEMGDEQKASQMDLKWRNASLTCFSKEKNLD